MAKSVVEDCKKIGIGWLKKNNFLGGSRSGTMTWTSGYNDSKSSIGLTTDTYNLSVHFQYTQTDYYTDEKSDMDYQFRLKTTPCNYGGVRYWFVCGLYKSGKFCGRAVAKLYKPRGSKWFGCRHCWELSYYARQQSRGGKYGFLFKALEIEDKAVKLQDKMKRWYWGGRPTRKHRRLLKYSNQLEQYWPLVNRTKP